MSENSCNSCGANGVVDMFTCSFCGSLVVEVTSAEDEMKAVDELVKTANTIAMKGAESVSNLNQQQSSGVSERNQVMSQVMRAQVDAEKQIRTFWKSSFTPNSVAAGSKMIAQLLGLMTQERATLDLMPRARAIVTHLKLSGDGSNLVQLQMVESELDRVDKLRVEAQKKKLRTGVFWAAFAIGLVLLLFYVLSSDEFPASMTGTYIREGRGPELMVSSSSMALGNGKSITYGGTAADCHINTKDDNNVEITAVHGEFSQWSGYETCKGSLSRTGTTLMVALVGDDFCNQFSGAWIVK